MSLTHIARITGLAFLLALTSCASSPQRDAGPTTFILVRHAEKANDDPRDPNLSEAGQARAQRLARQLAHQPLTAVYATDYRRTQQTAAPTAKAHDLAVTTYDAKQPADAFAGLLRARHREGTVLIVGHTNTAPAIAAALCTCQVAPMPETEYDRLITVRFGTDGRATLEQSRQR
jgi:broad specificity phosphatase PhoE